MKANELRIGNIVFDNGNNNDGEFNRQRTISGYDIECIEVDGCFYQSGTPEGVPLTEEWLLILGFKKYNHIKYCNWKVAKRKEKPIIRVGILDGKCYIRPIGWIEYVHQLQNIYFALTGEELVINAS